MNGDIYSAGFIILPAGLKFPTVVIPFLDWLKTQSEDHKITIPGYEMSDYNGRVVRQLATADTPTLMPSSHSLGKYDKESYSRTILSEAYQI